MTTNPKAARYNTRPVDRPAQPDAPGDGGMLFDNQDDGFGNLDFRRPEDRPAPPPAPAAETQPSEAPRDSGEETPDASVQPQVRKAVSEEEIASANAAIATEGLTSRQLRRAVAIAQKHRLDAKTPVDAVRLLREAGVDAFSRASLLRLVCNDPATTEIYTCRQLRTRRPEFSVPPTYFR